VAAVSRFPSAPSTSDRVRSRASGHSCTYSLSVTVDVEIPVDADRLTEGRLRDVVAAI
jgi:hypothetical protein